MLRARVVREAGVQRQGRRRPRRRHVHLARLARRADDAGNIIANSISILYYTLMEYVYYFGRYKDEIAKSHLKLTLLCVNMNKPTFIIYYINGSSHKTPIKNRCRTLSIII